MTTVRTHQPHRVYTKARWADDWTEQVGAYCTQMTFACSPEVGNAVIERHYGRIMRAGETAFETVSLLALNGSYIKVVLEQQPDDEPPGLPIDEGGVGEDESPAIVWYGVVILTDDNRAGIADGIPRGLQVFYCRSLEYLLQQKVIETSWVQRTNDEIEIGRAIGFNLGAGHETDDVRRGNMELEGDLGAAVFSKNLDDATEWNALEILNYLLKYHPPKNAEGDDVLQWQLAEGVTRDLLEVFKPAMQVHGMTFKQIVDAICDRRRLLSWYVTVEENEAGDETARIKVFSFNRNVVSIPSGGDLHPNENIESWFVDSENIIAGMNVLADDTSRFDKVIARGERLTGTFTVSKQRNNLEADWKPELETAYAEAASGDAGYSALTDDQQINANEAIRNTPRLLKVYRYFRIPPEWDGKSADEFVCPNPDNESESATFWMPGLRILHSLPLKTEHDYATIDPGVDDLGIVSETLARSEPEYLSPFGLLYDDSRYYDLSRMSRGTINALTMEAGGRWWSCDVRPQRQGPGITASVIGAPQHVIAEGDFVAPDANDTASGFKPQVSWEDIYFTISAQFDQHVEAAEPEGDPTTENDQLRLLRLYVPRARLDYLAPQTYIGVNVNGTVKTTTGGYVRDDRELLKDIAKAAFQWYGDERKAIELTQQNLTIDKRVGYLITQVGAAGANAVTVNSCITQMRFDLMQGTVSVRTAFAELDSVSFASGTFAAWR